MAPPQTLLRTVLPLWVSPPIQGAYVIFWFYYKLVLCRGFKENTDVNNVNFDEKHTEPKQTVLIF